MCLAKVTRNRHSNQRRADEQEKKRRGFTGGTIEVVDPTRNRLSQGRSHDSGSDDGKGNTAALLQQQMLGQRLGVCVSIGTLSN
jgi:hypothetical protein